MQDLLRSHTWLRNFLQILFTAGMYLLLARVSLIFQFESSNATPVWPSAGFAFAMILLWGLQITPGILVGAFVANFLIFISNKTVDYPTAVFLSTIIAAGNTGEALVGNYLLKRLIHDLNQNTFLDKVEHILRFSLTAALMSIVSSTVGTITVHAADVIPEAQVPIVWLTWWLGDCSGILLVTSFILIWYKASPLLPKFSVDYKKIRRESILFFAVVILSSGMIFDDWFFTNSFFKWAYWIIPILVWAALRFTQRELITALVIYSLVAIWGTVNYRGPFSHVTLNEALLALQAFIAIMVTTKLTLNASVTEQKQIASILRRTGDDLEIRVKQRTAQLEERNQFVETILNSSFDSIIVMDQETRCISINKIAKNQLRLPYPENVVGKKISEIPPFLLPDEIKEDITKALKGETIHREKFASPISEKFFEIDYIPLKNQAGVYAVMIVGHDITQRIHSELEIREQKAFAEMLIDYSPYMIMAYDKNLLITAWNKKSELHTGLKKEEIIGKHTHEIFPQYKNQQWINVINDVLTKGNSYHFPKIKFLYKEGWGESFMMPLYNGTDEVVGLLSITNDITELVETTSALEQKNKDLVKTNEELSSFAYVASHDLQEPLRKIQMFSRRIIETEYNILSDHSKDYFNRMKKAAERMQLLIEDLLTYSRTGSLSRKFEFINISELVNEVKEHLKDEIGHKKATVIAENMCNCTVIPFQFRQLLHNLFTNSLKFSKSNEPPVITIESSIKKGSELGEPSLDAEKKYCHISISDNGIGFDPQFNDQIFGLFQRLHGKSEYPGTGIGLAICKKIIENHHGVIKARGEPGKGATFDIYIPENQS